MPDSCRSFLRLCRGGSGSRRDLARQHLDDGLALHSGDGPRWTAAAIKFGSHRGGSGIIVRYGRRVGFWGNQRTKYDLKSTTKSFGSIITALAFKDGRIFREDRVKPILPEIATGQDTSQQKAWAAEIQVNHLLTHTAGIWQGGRISGLISGVVLLPLTGTISSRTIGPTSTSGCDLRLVQWLGQHFVDTPPVDVDHFEPPAAELERAAKPREAPELGQCEAGHGVVVAPCGQGEHLGAAAGQAGPPEPLSCSRTAMAEP